MAQMEVSYSRRLDYQYMTIAAGENEASDYRLSMLIHNRIAGFLPVHIQQINGTCTLSYEITSLEALPSFLDARKITYDEMVSLLLQFCSAVSEIGRYLLDGEGILLEPQYIYVSKSLERIRFCYYPYQHTPLYQSVNTLCRFLIDHIDYDDRKSLELAYGLFQESLKENLSISVIVGCIKNKIEESSDRNKDTNVDQNDGANADIDNGANTNIDMNMNELTQTSLRTDEKNDSVSFEKPKKNLSLQQTKNKGIMGNVIGILIVVVIVGTVLVMAGKRLLQLEVINENMLIAVGILVAIAFAVAGVAAYGLLKQRHR